jgi:hypothetical protein
MGIAVFSGMLGVTFFGLALTPVFYWTIRRAVVAATSGDGPGVPAPVTGTRTRRLPGWLRLRLAKAGE